MSNTLLSILLLAATLGCIVASMLINGMIVAGINSKRDFRSQLSYMNRGFFGTLALHRQLYPESILRGAMILALVLSVVFALGFALTQSL
jgi:hypothetical protein